MLSRQLVLQVAALGALSTACNQESRPRDPEAALTTQDEDQTQGPTSKAPKAAPAPLLLAQARLDTYKKALPTFAYAKLQEIVNDPATFWYDKETMIPSYQDSVGDDSGTPIGARANSQGKAVIVPEGKKFFSADGKDFSFPFGHTAGTDDSTNVHIANFLSLPVVDGKRLPVAYRTINDPNGASGLGLVKWTWTYPVGSVVGEVIFVKDKSGALYVAEVRTRTRYAKGWATNAYRPFPTATSLAKALKARRPQWESSENLRSLVEHLEGSDGMRSKTLSSTGFKDSFTQTGVIDSLPDFGDEALVKELLTKTPFVSSYGEAWKSNGSSKTFAASTTASFSIVPNNYAAGLIATTEASCSRCHQDAGRALSNWEPQTILYGDIWGEDQIFSFHPYDPSQYVNFNNENRRVRPLLLDSGLVAKFDAQKHKPEYYTKIK